MIPAMWRKQEKLILGLFHNNKKKCLSTLTSNSRKITLKGKIMSIKIFKLVITTGYGVRALTIEDQNAFPSTLCFA